MKKNKIIKFFIVSYFALFFLFNLSITKAQYQTSRGCCKVTTVAGGSNFVKAYNNLSADECNRYESSNIGIGTGTIVTPEFFSGNVATDDGSNCVIVDNAADTKKEPSKIVEPILQVSIPGFVNFSKVDCSDPSVKCQIPWLAEYIKAIYKYSITAIGILAIIMIMLGGIIWLGAGGNKGAINTAIGFIKGGTMGIIIALCSYILLVLLNPNLTILRPINIDYIKKEDVETMETESEIQDAQTDNEKYPDTKIFDPNSVKPSDVKGCDNCVVTSLQTKNNKNINKDLNAKLSSVNSSVKFVVTEAFPPTSTHQAKCHYNGHCVDIGIRPTPATCSNVDQLLADLKKAGLKILNEYTGCGGTQTKYGNGGHFHVSI